MLEALCILDCYRVVIVMRPPNMLWHGLRSIINNSAPDSELQMLHLRLKNAVNRNVTLPANDMQDSCMAPLAFLASNVWRAAYSRESAYPDQGTLEGALSMGKPDFAELACDDWLRGQSPHAVVDPSHLAIYHMMNIVMHANLTVLQTFAHAPSDSPHRVGDKSAVVPELRTWIHGRHYDIAQWHAERLISAVEGALPSNDSTASAPNLREERRLPFETPHVPYAIYYASLVLWCKDAILHLKSSSAQVKAPIVRGERLLLLHKVHVAQLLARVLDTIE